MSLRKRLTRRKTAQIEWEGDVLTVRELSASETEHVVAVEAKSDASDELTGLKVTRLCFAYALVDEDGKQIYQATEVDGAIAELPMSLVAAVGECAMRLSEPAPSGKKQAPFEDSPAA